MAIQQSPEKMLPLSDIYKVKFNEKSNFFFLLYKFCSLLLIDFPIIEQIHKNGRIL